MNIRFRGKEKLGKWLFEYDAVKTPLDNIEKAWSEAVCVMATRKFDKHHNDRKKIKF